MPRRRHRYLKGVTYPPNLGSGNAVSLANMHHWSRPHLFEELLTVAPRLTVVSPYVAVAELAEVAVSARVMVRVAADTVASWPLLSLALKLAL